MSAKNSLRRINGHGCQQQREIIMITSKTMSIEQWAQVQDNPIQRDTELHAKKAILGHLKQDSATHARVAAAILPNGEMYKLDGHTRSYLWSIGKLTPPKAVLVDVYHVETIADVIETYKHFDNSSAAENATDRLRGALKLHGINAKSGVILYAGLTTALSFIYVKKSKCFDVIEPIGNFKKEIMLIDSLGLTYKQMTAGVLAAMILSVRIYGEQAIPFFVAYHNNEGVKNGNHRDAVQALVESMAIARASKTMQGWANSMTVMGKTLSAVQAYLEKRTYTVGIKATDVKLYIQKHKTVIFGDIDNKEI
jgi:hypothetical protein